jgi:transcriptional regulator with XRE-family HTH domain
VPYDEAKLRGVRLQAARALKGLGQKKAAELIGVSRTTLSGWENGESIDEYYLDAIVRTYGGSKGWVRYGDGKGPPGYNAVDPVELETTEEVTLPIVEVRAPKKQRKKRRVQGSRPQRPPAHPPAPQGHRK